MAVCGKYGLWWSGYCLSVGGYRNASGEVKVGEAE